ncbi:hypothetical protein G6F46_002894 [Rhizopus delemar]|uniref:Uncharacterized protein n=2 Tax=Rhizopus TaxID=4842 RepID=A0A9P6ZBK6_9FUNG|nr:hypothetical protein G6F55_001766 [Rhizopus delemar]KAG1549837.1 hypothetical protein G6F51_002812 [Rhizopus arrhizus]KAG1502656.1 hypothetical protein G6F54_002212 [Rhizopus delemar]KAG1516164.1 hypothetical protein G6F53_002367 [Rhizopus delemar]KAG1528777.1 hypothetical protein G6F52_000347 [Rhizopus delemar]
MEFDKALSRKYTNLAAKHWGQSSVQNRVSSTPMSVLRPITHSQYFDVSAVMPSQETSPHPLDDIKTPLSMIQCLINEIDAAKSKIEHLFATTKQLQNQLNKEQSSPSQPTSNIALNAQSSSDFPEATTAPTPWRNPEQAQTAARLLQPPSKNQGFQYLYLSTKARFPVGQVRSRLRKLKINNDRILDISYPDRHDVALMVDNDYADEL